MRLLLDSHVVLWWIFDDPALPKAARAAIAEPDAEIFVSAASAGEISLKHRLGRLPEAGDVPARLPAYLARASFQPLDVDIEDAITAATLDGFVPDPFDRVLIAQARRRRLTVVSDDPVFRASGVATVW